MSFARTAESIENEDGMCTVHTLFVDLIGYQNLITMSYNFVQIVHLIRLIII